MGSSGWARCGSCSKPGRGSDVSSRSTEEREKRRAHNRGGVEPAPARDPEQQLQLFGQQQELKELVGRILAEYCRPMCSAADARGSVSAVCLSPLEGPFRAVFE